MAYSTVRYGGKMPSGLTHVAVLGAPGASYCETDGGKSKMRVLSPDGIERAHLAAAVIGDIQRPGTLLLHSGYGLGYKLGGPRPESYEETEAAACEDLINAILHKAGGPGLKARGWKVTPGIQMRDIKPAPGADDGQAPRRVEVFSSSDFSYSTVREAYLVGQSCRELGKSGMLGVVGGPGHLARFMDASEVMGFGLEDQMIGIETAGRFENTTRERMIRRVYQRAVLPGPDAPADPGALLLSEGAFMTASPLGRAALFVFGPTDFQLSSSLA